MAHCVRLVYATGWAMLTVHGLEVGCGGPVAARCGGRGHAQPSICVVHSSTFINKGHHRGQQSYRTTEGSRLVRRKPVWELFQFDMPFVGHVACDFSVIQHNHYHYIYKHGLQAGLTCPRHCAGVRKVLSSCVPGCLQLAH